jgi:hypothetical protein
MQPKPREGETTMTTDLFDIKRNLEKAQDEIERGDPEKAAQHIDLALADCMNLIAPGQRATGDTASSPSRILRPDLRLR